MSEYRVSVEEGDSNPFFEFVMYAVLFTILLPVGLIWLIVKIVVMIRNHRHEKAEREQERIRIAASRAEDRRLSLYGELSTLNNLRLQGAITQDEFDRRKESIMRQIDKIVNNDLDVQHFLN